MNKKLKKGIMMSIIGVSLLLSGCNAGDKEEKNIVKIEKSSESSTSKIYVVTYDDNTTKTVEVAKSEEEIQEELFKEYLYAVKSTRLRDYDRNMPWTITKIKKEYEDGEEFLSITKITKSGKGYAVEEQTATENYYSGFMEKDSKYYTTDSPMNIEISLSVFYEHLGNKKLEEMLEDAAYLSEEEISNLTDAKDMKFSIWGLDDMMGGEYESMSFDVKFTKNIDSQTQKELLTVKMNLDVIVDAERGQKASAEIIYNFLDYEINNIKYITNYSETEKYETEITVSYEEDAQIFDGLSQAIDEKLVNSN